MAAAAPPTYPPEDAAALAEAERDHIVALAPSKLQWSGAMGHAAAASPVSSPGSGRHIMVYIAAPADLALAGPQQLVWAPPDSEEGAKAGRITPAPVAKYDGEAPRKLPVKVWMLPLDDVPRAVQAVRWAFTAAEGRGEPEDRAAETDLPRGAKAVWCCFGSELATPELVLGVYTAWLRTLWASGSALDLLACHAQLLTVLVDRHLPPFGAAVAEVAQLWRAGKARGGGEEARMLVWALIGQLVDAHARWGGPTAGRKHREVTDESGAAAAALWHAVSVEGALPPDAAAIQSAAEWAAGRAPAAGGEHAAVGVRWLYDSDNLAMVPSWRFALIAGFAAALGVLGAGEGEEEVEGAGAEGAQGERRGQRTQQQQSDVPSEVGVLACSLPDPVDAAPWLPGQLPDLRLPQQQQDASEESRALEKQSLVTWGDLARSETLQMREQRFDRAVRSAAAVAHRLWATRQALRQERRWMDSVVQGAETALRAAAAGGEGSEAVCQMIREARDASQGALRELEGALVQAERQDLIGKARLLVDRGHELRVRTKQLVEVFGENVGAEPDPDALCITTLCGFHPEGAQVGSLDGQMYRRVPRAGGGHDMRPGAALRPTHACQLADGSGRVVICESSTSLIRLFTPPAGGRPAELVTIAGRGGVGNQDGPAAHARFRNPESVLAIRGTEVLIADTGNHALRVIAYTVDAEGHGDWVTQTISGGRGRGATDGALGAAQWNEPRGMCGMPDGSIVVADSGNHSVRLLEPPAGQQDDDAAGAAGAAGPARRNLMHALGVGARVITIAGVTRKLGSNDGPVGKATLNRPSAVCPFFSTTLMRGVLFTDRNAVRFVCWPFRDEKKVKRHYVATLAGDVVQRGKAPGQDLTCDKARFDFPGGIAFVDGRVLVSDTLNHCIRVVTPARDYVEKKQREEYGFQIDADSFFRDEGGRVTPRPAVRVSVLAGKPGQSTGAWIDGYGRQSRLDTPRQLSECEDGSLLLSEGIRLRSLAPPSVVERAFQRYREIQRPIDAIAEEIAALSRSCTLNSAQAVDSLRRARVRFLQGRRQSERQSFRSFAPRVLQGHGGPAALRALVASTPDLESLVWLLEQPGAQPAAWGEELAAALAHTRWLPSQQEQEEGLVVLVRLTQSMPGVLGMLYFAAVLRGKGFRCAPCVPLAEFCSATLGAAALGQEQSPPEIASGLARWAAAAAPRGQAGERLTINKLLRGTLRLWASFWEEAPRGGKGSWREGAAALCRWVVRYAGSEGEGRSSVLLRSVARGLLSTLQPQEGQGGGDDGAAQEEAPRIELPQELIGEVASTGRAAIALLGPQDAFDLLSRPPDACDDSGGDTDLDECPPPTRQDLELRNGLIGWLLSRLPLREDAGLADVLEGDAELWVSAVAWYAREARGAVQSPGWELVKAQARKAGKAFLKGAEQLASGDISITLVEKCTQSRDQLRPAWMAAGAKQADEAVGAAAREVSAAAAELRHLDDVLSSVLSDSEESARVAHARGALGTLLLSDLRSLLGTGAAKEGVCAPLPPLLRQASRWIAEVSQCTVFHKVWNQLDSDPQAPRGVPRIPVAAEAFAQLLRRFADGSVTFAEVAELEFGDHNVEFPRLESRPRQHVSFGAQLQLFCRCALPVGREDWDWTPDRHHDSVLVVNLRAALASFRRLYRVRHEQQGLLQALDLLQLWVRPGAQHTVTAVREATTELAAELEKAGEWDQLALKDLPRFDPIAVRIDHRILDLSPVLLEALSKTGEFLEWLAEHSSSQNFTSAVEMAMGRPEMECPPELWVDDGAGPGHPDEARLSQLTGVRTALHRFLYRGETLQCASLDELVGCLAALTLEKQEATAEVLMEIAPLHLALAELLSDDSDASALSRLANLQQPQWAACWCLSTEDHSAPVQVVLEYQVPRHKESLMARQGVGELLDFQSAVVLARGRSAESAALVQTFVAQFGWVRELAAAWGDLRSAGHFDYQGTVERRPISIPAGQLRGEVTACRELLGQWESEVDDHRRRYPLLNAFTMRQLISLRAALEADTPLSGMGGGMGAAEVAQCAFPAATVGVDAVGEELLKAFREAAPAQDAKGGSSGGAALARLGRALSALPRGWSIPRFRPIEGGGAPAAGGGTLPGLTEGEDRRLQLIVAEGAAKALETVLSAFARCGALPEWDQLAWVGERSEWEDIHVLLLRWAAEAPAAGQGAQRRLFCLAGIDRLHHTLHHRAVALISELADTAPNNLLIVAGSREHYCVRQLAQWRTAAAPLPAALLALVGQAAASSGAGLTVHVSAAPGQGKSFGVRTQAQAAEKEVVTVAVHQGLGSAALISAVEQAVAERGVRQGGWMLHLDISDTAGAGVEAALASLCLLGSLYDDTQGRRWFLGASTPVALEASAAARGQLALLGHLPCVDYVASAESLQVFAPELQAGMGREEFAAPRCDGTTFHRLNPGSSERQSGADAHQRLQFVAAALQARKDHCGLPAHIGRPKGIIGAKTCWDLATEAGQLRTPVSLWAFWSFVNTVYWLMRDTFDPLSPLPRVIRGDGSRSAAEEELCLAKLRGEALAFVCRTAADFATRQRRAVEGDANWLRMTRSLGEHGSVRDYYRRACFDCDGAPVYRMGTYLDPTYIYYRAGGRGQKSMWVMSQTVEPAGPVERCREADTVDGQWKDYLDPGSSVLERTSGTLINSAQMAEEKQDKLLWQAQQEDGPLATAEEFGDLKRWTEANHEVMLVSIEAKALRVLALDRAQLHKRMHPLLLRRLEANGVDVGGGLHRIEQHHDVLAALTNVTRDPAAAARLLGGTFCLTGDVVLKMLAVVVRVRCGVPVLLMGECGCGKTHMLRYVCAWLGAPLVVLDVHGGTTEEDILGVFAEARERLAKGDSEVFVFLDEVNTCAHMGLIAEATVGRALKGASLPDAVHVLAACNPFRKWARRGNSNTPGLSYRVQGKEVSPIADPLSDLVYRVHPIPARMHEFVFDFGSLTDEQEAKYIAAMVESQLPTCDHGGRGAIAQMLCRAQNFVRTAEGDPSVVSLRDIKRALSLVKWFSKYGAGKATAGRHEWSAPAVLGLAHVFYFRLATAQLRAELLSDLRLCLRTLSESKQVGWHWLFDAGVMSKVVRGTMKTLCAKLDIDEGIAMNESLTENLYVTMICIFNRVPVFVVGKPGSSKTLTLQVLASNLRGDQSANPYWRRFPALYIFPYQCSPLSTAQGIQHQFDIACSYQRKAQRTIVVLLLDEVGLAEHSPDMPLKVLHGILVKPKVAIVGLSNWALDAAKMNRAICLQRPEPAQSDIHLIGQHILGPSGGAEADASPKAAGKEKPKKAPAAQQASWLEPLSAAYHAVYVGQRGRDFIGMRDYYQTVKLLRRELRLQSGDPATLGAPGAHFLTDKAIGGEWGSYFATLDRVELEEGKDRLFFLQAPDMDVDVGQIARWVREGVLALDSILSPDQLAVARDGWRGAEAAAASEPAEGRAAAFRELAARRKQPVRGLLGEVGPLLLCYVLARNFSGKEDTRSDVLRRFGTECFKKEDALTAHLLPTPRLIAANLQDPAARHLMVLTRNCAALPLLLSTGLLREAEATVLVGSGFHDDSHELYLIQQVNMVKAAMAAGQTVVLVNHDNIYESLYDVLNQRYVTRVSMETGRPRKMLRLAIGARSQLCPVQEGFRIVVVAEAEHAYTNLDLPLLNRFEKQVLNFVDCLSPEQQKLADGLAGWAASVGQQAGLPLPQVFCGFNPGTVPSLVLAATTTTELLQGDDDGDSAAEVEKRLRRRLASLALPVAVQQSGELRGAAPEYHEHHGSAAALLRRVLTESEGGLGQRVLLLTHSPLQHLSHAGLRQQMPAVGWSFLRLAELSSEAQMLQHAEDFFASPPAGGCEMEVLLVQCDPMSTPQPLIDHARRIAALRADAWRAAAERLAKHVVFAVHLPPGARHRTRQYDVDFVGEWSCYFVDDVREDGAGAEGAQRVMSQSLLELAERGEVDLLAIAARKVPQAMALLAAPWGAHESPAAAYAARLAAVSSAMASDKRFRELTERCLSAALRQHAVITETGMHLHLALAVGDLAVGSLRMSVHVAIETIVTQALAHVLRALDVNFALGLCSGPAEIVELWHAMAARAVDPDTLATTCRLDGAPRAEAVRNTGQGGGPLVARFPFSHLVMEQLLASRDALERQWEKTVEYAKLPQSFAALYGEGIAQAVQRFTAAARASGGCLPYVADVARAVVPSFGGLSLREQLRIVETVVRIEHPSAADTPLGVHAALWRNEALIFNLLSLLSQRSEAEQRRVIDAAASAEQGGVKTWALAVVGEVLSGVWRELRSLCDSAAAAAPGDAPPRRPAGPAGWLEWAHGSFPRIEADVAPLGAPEGTGWDGLRCAALLASSCPEMAQREGAGQWVDALRPLAPSLRSLKQCVGRAGGPAALPPGGADDLVVAFIRDFAAPAGERNTRVVAQLAAGKEPNDWPHPPQLPGRRALAELLLRWEGFDGACRAGAGLGLGAAEAERLGCLIAEAAEELGDPVAKAEFAAADVAAASQLRPLDSKSLGALLRCRRVVLRVAANLAAAAEVQGRVDQPRGLVGSLHRKLLALPDAASLCLRQLKLLGGSELVLDVLRHLPLSTDWLGCDRQYLDSFGEADLMPATAALVADDPDSLRRLFHALREAARPGGQDQEAKQQRAAKVALDAPPDQRLCAVYAVRLELERDTSGRAAAPQQMFENILRQVQSLGEKQGGRCAAWLRAVGWGPQGYRRAETPGGTSQRRWNCDGAVRMALHALLFHVALAAPKAPGSILHALMVQPQACKTWFFPACPWESEVQVVVRSLTGREGFLTWYRCPRGHLYSIGECGGPMEVGRCAQPGCGAVIGGRGHTPAAGNVRVGTTDEVFAQAAAGQLKGDPGYMFDERGQYDQSPVMRRGYFMGAVTQSAIRLLIHLAMCCGADVNPAGLRQLCQKATHQDILSRCEKDWAELRRHLQVGNAELQLAMHAVIPAVTAALLGSGTLKTTAHCVRAERAMEEAIGTVLSRDGLIRVAEQSKAKLGEDSVARALERALPDDLARQLDGTGVPVLWRTRLCASFEHFKKYFQSAATHTDSHPLLAAVMVHEERLPLIKHLAAVLEWHKVLFDVFPPSQPLSRHEAQQMSGAAAVQRAPPAARRAAEEALQGYCAAFNAVMPLLPLLFECQANPFLRDGQVCVGEHGGPLTPECSLAFSLPSQLPGEQDAAGLCSIQIAALLQNTHNTVLTALAARARRAAGARGGAEAAAGAAQPEAAPAPVISAATPAGELRRVLLCYSRDTDLLPLLHQHKRQGPGPCDGTALGYDLERIERALARRLCDGKRPVALQLRHYHYQGEVRQRGGLTALLAREQSPGVPPQVEEAVREELDTQQQLGQLLRLLEDAVNFAAAVGAPLDPQCPLSHYLRDAMGVPAEVVEEALPAAVARYAQLRHLKALFLLAEACMQGGGVLDRVAARYREELGEAERGALEQASVALRGQALLTAALRDLLTGPLSGEDGSFAPSESLKDFLGYQDMDLGDADWFQELFPEGLQLRHAMAVYDSLSAPR